MRLGIVLALLAAILALVAVLLGSCGGDPKPLTYPQFQQQASGACLRYHRGLARLGAPTSLARIGRIAHGATRLGERERTELGQIVPPRDAADGFSQMLDGFARADALLPDLRAFARAGDADAAQRLVRQGRAIVAEANLHALAVGLADCRRT
jgi:hypothetical protein